MTMRSPTDADKKKKKNDDDDDGDGDAVTEEDIREFGAKIKEHPELTSDWERHPLFADAAAWKDPDASKIDMEALNALLRTQKPEEVAEELKEKGNKALRRGLPRYYREAYDHYSEAIAVNSPIPTSVSIYYANRAHASLLLGNYLKALHDAVASVRLNPKNTKGWYRAARACLELGRYDECVQFCGELKDEKEGVALAAKAKALLAKKMEKREAEQREHEKQQQRDEELVARLKQSGVVVGEALFDLNAYKGKDRVFIGGDGDGGDGGGRGLLHWPVLLLFPQTHMTNFIQDVREDFTLAQELAEVFRENQMSGGDYAVYLPLHCVPPIAAFRSREEATRRGKKQLVEASRDMALGDILRIDGCVVPGGVPSFFILPSLAGPHRAFSQNFIREWEQT